MTTDESIDNDSPDDTPNDTPNDTARPTGPRRPLAYWLRVVDALIGDALREAFAESDESAVHAGAAVHTRIADAVSEDDLATTLATLEAIAREFGWEGSAQPLPSRERGRTFGPGHGRKHGRKHGGMHGGKHGRMHGTDDHPGHRRGRPHGREGQDSRAHRNA